MPAMTILAPVLSALPASAGRVSAIEANWCAIRGAVEIHFYASEKLVASWLLFQRPEDGLIDFMIEQGNPYEHFRAPVALYVECQKQHVAPSAVVAQLEVAISLIFDIQDRKKH
ncbi:hypothetical protein SAMN04488527_1685 [Aliiroseovarius crassostreae]|uniref:Uncharacterized protein n=2 Tax=Aliiroseovarius crassostreae TaxID=154981 RepID=A0A0P7I206_9RHOB|nr:hypothetical protein [Aliiroseovarius crassostreae]KPN62974.1 hypothetical protein AKJ29_02160 [Aliiroseovarius crassostreae]SFU98310.1 hypothetical protein SAMN04488527_1685 [Aliiroseovarius crassostreae]